MMAYKAQLVIRTNDIKDAELLEKVREFADGRGETLSEAGLELLRRGLNKDAPSTSKPVASKAAASKAATPKAAAPKERATPKVNGATTSAPTKKPIQSLGPVPAPKKIVQAYLAGRESNEDATKILIDFFAVAGPAEVHVLKQALQKALTNDDYDAVMQPIMETEIYREYKKRVLLSL
ncbi:MAG: hypothetical protein ACNA8W_04410 [Bradymonadaceae bacterium]